MTENKEKLNFKPIVGLAVISLLICGLFFPLLVTGIGQVLFPYQANGEIVQLNGKDVGSNLIAQNFTLPIFFHPRNDSASGVDPDITASRCIFTDTWNKQCYRHFLGGADKCRKSKSGRHHVDFRKPICERSTN